MSFSLSRIILLFRTGLLLSAFFVGLPQAQAIPGFARQTGLECAACHVGGFGPQLTQFGRQFKLNGYTLGDARANMLANFSGIVIGGYSNMGRGTDFPSPESRFGSNNVLSMDQATLAWGGRLYDHVGALIQTTYTDPLRTFSWDESDVRYANTASIFGSDLIYGVTVNNNPSTQDVWQTTPSWQFPYVSPVYTVTPSYAPVIMGALAERVLGAGLYVLWNDWVYAELSTYSGLGAGQQRALGMVGGDTAPRVGSYNPYWRVAVQHDFGPHYVELGGYGMLIHQYPEASRDTGTDHYNDFAIDGTYQTEFDEGKHIVSVYGTAIRELLLLSATNGLGNSSNLKNRTTTFTGNVSYNYLNRYGLTVGRTVVTGTPDSILWGASGATPSARPNSRFWTFQTDYTPDLPSVQWVKPRFFVQYTLYGQVDGAAANYDGNGRNASDNNTLFGGVWLAF